MAMKYFLRNRSRITSLSRDTPFSIELPNHRLQYQPGGATLVVSFDNAARPANEPYEGRPTWGESYYLEQDHALLGVIARKPDWYRCTHLIAALEDIANQGFFDGFARVVLTGGSMGGFAAAAFAPITPGCIVIAMSPQSTLKSDLVPWETRFESGRRQDWSLPYGDGAAGIRSASQAYVVYDNLDIMDKRHADRLTESEQVTHLRIPAGGHGVSPTLNQMGVLKKLTGEMIDGSVDSLEFPRLARLRRKTPQYRRVLANHALMRKRLHFAERVCELSIPLFPNSDLPDILKKARTASRNTSKRVPDTVPHARKPKMPAVEPHRFDQKFPNLKRNIFIVTYGRTGSTLLQNLMMTIPGCDMRGENHNVIESIWNATIRCRKAKNTWGAKQQPDSHPWYGSDQMKPVMFARGMIDSFVDNVLCPPKDCRYFGFKEIRYNAWGDRLPEVLDFMRFHFKDAFFVFNKRHVDDVSKSAWWKNWKREDVVALVEGMDRRFGEYHDANPEFTSLFSYEEFSTDPQAMRPLFDKLGEPFNEAAIRAILDKKLTH